MAIEKRITKDGKVTYRVRLRQRGRGDRSATHARLADARAWEARMRVAAPASGEPRWPNGQSPAMSEVFDRYLNLLPTLGLKDERNRRRHVHWWRQEFNGLRLGELAPARIALARDKLLTTPIPARRRQAMPRTLAPATVVRHLAALSHVLSVATDDWGWLESNPMRKVRKPRQPRGRVRYLSDPERTQLLQACRESTSEALLPVVILALATGMRKGEILSLRWWQVDLERGLVTLEHTKNGERRQLPLVGPALAAIVDLAGEHPQPPDLVFPGEVRGRPRDITKAWTTAVKKAGLADFRFHDLRHTTASYLAMRGASLLQIGEVLGHKSPQMTRRYAHLSIEHTREVLAGMVDATLPAETLLPARAPDAAN